MRLAVLAVLASACVLTKACDRSRVSEGEENEKQRRGDDSRRDADVGRLIDHLAASDDYCSTVASQAFTQIGAMGVSAFARLVNRVGDSRQAWKCFQANTESRTTVGDLCLTLLRAQVEVELTRFGGHTETRDTARGVVHVEAEAKSIYG